MRFRLVQKICAQIKAVFDQLEIGVELDLKLDIGHALAAGLVDAAPFRLHRKRQRQGRRRPAVEQQVSDLAENAAEGDLAAIVEIGDVADLVRGNKRPELELDVLVGREFEFELGLARAITSVTLADPRLGIKREFLLAFQADAGAFGETEHVFGFDVAIDDRSVLRAGTDTRRDEKQRGR